MAVVQISRIQHRRGRKNTSTGMPQLSSGELGWAIDTQELYIGNGSVAEGAPYVGNTKVLTEHDNIFEVANQYSYKPTSNIWGFTTPTGRNLQNKLDDVVSVFDFGATGDGTDQTVAIQKAIDSLFKNSEVSNRVILWFPAGEYTISAVLEIPPYTTLRGAGKGKTIITANNCDLLKTIHYDPANPLATINTNNQARYVEITDMTLATDSDLQTCLDLRSCNYSVFKNLRLEGQWDFGDVSSNHKAISLFSETTAITCQGNLFDNIEIDSFNFGIYSDYDIKNNLFTGCNFYKMKYGVTFGFGIGSIGEPPIGSVGQLTGPLYNILENSTFDRVDKEGFYVKFGEYNTSRGNRYHNVGSDSADVPVAVTPIIKFETNTNLSDGDFFARTEAYTPNSPTSNTVNQEYVPEVSGRTNFKNKFSYETTIGYTNFLPQSIIKLPIVDSGTIFIDYIYTEDTLDLVREGTIELVINQSSSNVILNENFTYIGNPLYTSSLTFSAAISDYGSVKSNEDTVVLSAVNDIPVVSDSFFYTIRVKS
jgi:hypothetical protein